jgi:deoxyribose-phosphate aldolase
MLKPREVAQLLDHSLLNPKFTEREIIEGTLLARELGCATVCALPYAMGEVSRLLQGSSCLPSSTAGFPHGANLSRSKADETRALLELGTVEIDMVVNISKVKSHDYDYVRDDIRAVLDEVRKRDAAKLKVIFENCYLTDDEKIRLCEICGELSVDWVKTSTGYGSSGATDADLILMRKHSPAHVQVKAAGGLRTLDDVLRAASLGATRVGASQSRAILEECQRRTSAS